MTAPYETLPTPTRDSLLVGYLAGAWRNSPQQLSDYPNIAGLDVTDDQAWADDNSLRQAAQMTWTADGRGDFFRDCARHDTIAAQLNATYVDRMVILTNDADRPCDALGPPRLSRRRRPCAAPPCRTARSNALTA